MQQDDGDGVLLGGFDVDEVHLAILELHMRQARATQAVSLKELYSACHPATKLCCTSIL